MVLKCYFDGGNKSDSTEYDVVTLAALAGTDEYWKPFERAWIRNLDKHHAGWLHTVDVVTLSDPFSKRNGWSAAKANAFLGDCVKIAGKYLARPITDTEPEGRMGIYPYSITLNLKDYLRARDEVAGLPANVDEVLATESMTACIEFGVNFAQTNKFHLVYDRSEPFRGHVLDRQRSPKALKSLPLYGNIISNTKANMRYVPALQLADLIAWCVTHEDEDEKREWKRKMLANPADHRYGEYKDMLNPIQETIALSKACRFPKRKPTR